MTRRYKVDLTKFDETWKRTARRILYDGATWLTLYRRKRSSALLEVVIASEDNVSHKARYDLVWDGVELSGADYATLKMYRPGLLDALMQQSDKIFPQPHDVAPSVGKFRMFSTYHKPDKWEVVHELGELDGGRWYLARRKGLNETSWVDLWLYSVDKVPHKASYYLGWNGDRLTLHPHLETLVKYRYELFIRLATVLGCRTDVVLDIQNRITNRGTKPTDETGAWGEFIDNTGDN